MSPKITFPVLFLLPFIHLSLGHRYSFCSQNKKYVFTSDACPGGVLLKKPLEIDEPCNCFESDIKLFQSCINNETLGTGTIQPHSITTCSKQPETTKRKVQLLFPLRSKSKPAKYEYCPSPPSSCKSLKENEVLSNPGLSINEITDFDSLSPPEGPLRPGRSVRKTRSIPDIKSIYEPPPETIPKYRRDASTLPITANNLTIVTTTPIGSDQAHKEALAVLKLMENLERQKNLGDADPISNLNIFKLLKKSVEMFKILASDLVIRDSIVDEVFLVLQSEVVSGVDIQELLEMDSKISPGMFQYVMEALENCHMKQDGSPFKEYIFEAKGECPPVLGSFYHPKKKMYIPLSTLTMPEAYLYKPNKEDLVLGLMWKVIDAIHAECFGFWQTLDGSATFYYFSFLENFFNEKFINEKFYSDDDRGTSAYEALLEVDQPLSSIMENVDNLVKAIHYRSRFKNYFHKPVDKKLSSSVRRKRNVSLKDFEIWGGSAYCLQKLDSNRPPSFDNSFPKIDYLCNS